MKTVQEILLLSADYLRQKGIENARRQAEDVIADSLEIKRLQLYLLFDRPLTDPELDECRRNLQRRGTGEPSQYIRGEVDFLNCVFKVTPDVLIPRQETEILVDKMIRELSQHDLQGKELWDVCCGSGCIGITLKKHFPQLKVVLSDVSEKALAIAKENAADNKVQVEFLQGDLLQPFQGCKVNFFVCNPPYIAESEFAELDKEVKDFEPKEALISGPSGVECYERLAKDLPTHLSPGAMVWFEIGHTQGDAIGALFSGKPWVDRRIEQDYSGKDRFFFLEIE